MAEHPPGFWRGQGGDKQGFEIGTSELPQGKTSCVCPLATTLSRGILLQLSRMWGLLGTGSSTGEELSWGPCLSPPLTPSLTWALQQHLHGPPPPSRCKLWGCFGKITALLLTTLAWMSCCSHSGCLYHHSCIIIILLTPAHFQKSRHWLSSVTAEGFHTAKHFWAWNKQKNPANYSVILGITTSIYCLQMCSLQWLWRRKLRRLYSVKGNF